MYYFTLYTYDFFLLLKVLNYSNQYDDAFIAIDINKGKKTSGEHGGHAEFGY